MEQLYDKLISSVADRGITETLPPLVKTQADYDAFAARHAADAPAMLDLASYSGKAYLGVDAGSTTTKLVLINETGDLLYLSLIHI